VTFVAVAYLQAKLRSPSSAAGLAIPQRSQSAPGPAPVRAQLGKAG